MINRWIRRLLVLMPFVAFASLLIGLVTLLILAFIWFVYL